MTGNLFADLPPPRGTSCGARSTLESEQFSELLARPGLRIERIVSTGQASPANFWFDQAEGEWVLLVQGEALLRFADEAEARRLRPGEFIDIAPHRRHRVEWTQAEPPTIWLAIHYAA